MGAVITALIGPPRSLVHPVILMILLVPMVDLERLRFAGAQGPGDMQGLGTRG